MTPLSIIIRCHCVKAYPQAKGLTRFRKIRMYIEADDKANKEVQFAC